MHPAAEQLRVLREICVVPNCLMFLSYPRAAGVLHVKDRRAVLSFILSADICFLGCSVAAGCIIVTWSKIYHWS